MVEILQFLANSISSGAIGHYISKGLNKIDSELPLLLQNETDFDKLQKIISAKSIEDDVRKFAEEVSNKFNNENSRNVVNFAGGVNYGVVANKVEITSRKKHVKVEAPQEAIASSLIHRNYIKHLIDRYHDFKEAEVGKDEMNYKIFYGSIKRKFGAKWDMIPLSKFQVLMLYIQERIDKTRLGRSKKANRSKSYSSFEEYAEKYYD